MCIHIRIAPFGNLRINSYLLIPAAYHVLRRLLMPRHSPYALLSLTIFELCLILLIFMLIAGFLPDFNFRYCRSFFLICITFAFHYSIFKFRSLQDLSCWWAQVDSNHRPHAYQACALTTWAMRPYDFRSSSFVPWWRWGESNSWPPACKAGALPAELHPHMQGLGTPLCCFKDTVSSILKIEQKLLS